MGDVAAVLLLIACGVGGLLLVPLGLPGLWVMALGALGYGWLTDFRAVTGGIIGWTIGLALLGEIVEAWAGFRMARRFGGSSRASWGALVGGLVGAVVGVPVPLIGSVLGGFVGAFAGAAIFEYWGAQSADGAVGAGWGAVLGRAAGAAGKIALGVVIGVVVLFAILRG